MICSSIRLGSAQNARYYWSPCEQKEALPPSRRRSDSLTWAVADRVLEQFWITRSAQTTEANVRRASRRPEGPVSPSVEISRPLAIPIREDGRKPTRRQEQNCAKMNNLAALSFGRVQPSDVRAVLQIRK